MGSVYDNARSVLERAQNAALRAGHQVTLVAASKMNDAARVREAFDAGIRAFGENRAQELEEKYRAGAYEGASLHFIGHLQKNKVKSVVGKADLIESVDSAELLGLIAQRAAALGIVQRVLLEVNIGGEASKTGAPAEEIPRMAEAAGDLPGIQVLGLMTIPPICGQKEKTLRYFQETRNLFVDMSGKKYDNVTMSILSMGMSADFEEAILCGANMVRVGSAIFGRRIYPGESTKIL